MNAITMRYKVLTSWLNGLTGAAKYLAWSFTALIVGTVLAVPMSLYLPHRSGFDYTFIGFATLYGASCAFWSNRRIRDTGKPKPPVTR